LLKRHRTIHRTIRHVRPKTNRIAAKTRPRRPLDGVGSGALSCSSIWASIGLRIGRSIGCLPRSLRHGKTAAQTRGDSAGTHLEAPDLPRRNVRYLFPNRTNALTLTYRGFRVPPRSKRPPGGQLSGRPSRYRTLRAVERPNRAGQRGARAGKS